VKPLPMNANDPKELSQVEPKIILFLCVWGPHAAFQTLQDLRRPIAPGIKMVRIPCSGRISKALLFKPFEMGADGVAMVGCEKGTCRYGVGADTAENNVATVRRILDLLGLSAERLRFATFMPEDADGLQKFLSGFSEDLKTLGRSPVETSARPEPAPDLPAAIRRIVAAHDVFACQDCGKCTSACSLTLSGKPFSPRAIASALIRGEVTDPAFTEGVWSCLTCGLCRDRCPSAVNFPEFIRDVRWALGSSGKRESHGGFFHSLSRTMTSPGLKGRHWDWLPGDIKTDPAGKTLFFGGCAPYFDLFFKSHMKVRTTDILADSLRLLNFFDIHPQVLDDERCCGHDLLWSGDRENFLKLARLNVDAIHARGVEEVICSCPEGYRTLAVDYPAMGVETRFKVHHLYEVLEREIDRGAVTFKEFPHKITYQDPCRLSRLTEGEDSARKLLSRIRPKAFTEMADRARSAICCGNCAWMGCDSFSKALQVKRLRQARETGGEVLVTACPKCQIHLTCAMGDNFLKPDIEMEVMDLATLLSQTIQWE